MRNITYPEAKLVRNFVSILLQGNLNSSHLILTHPTIIEIGRKVLFGGVVCELSDFVVSSDSFDLLSIEYQDLAVNVLA